MYMYDVREVWTVGMIFMYKCMYELDLQEMLDMPGPGTKDKTNPSNDSCEVMH